jgi:predicted nucleic acid-binding protein
MNAIDTNVFVYLFDVDEPTKRARADVCINKLVRSPEPTVLLWQVACEFLGVLRRWQRTQKISDAVAARNFQDVLTMFPLVLPTVQQFEVSERLLLAYSLSHWDALLLAAGQIAGVTTLYSEDLQAGAQYESVSVVNPFA